MKQPTTDYSFVKAADALTSAPEQGLLRRVGCYNDKLFLAEHRMQKGWTGARHQHPHEQIVYIVSGHLKVTVGTDTFSAHAGDSFVVRGGVEHQAEALEESVVIDVFTPCREDYL
jgi:quercetin dioxygenase-like cupin family protein